MEGNKQERKGKDSGGDVSQIGQEFVIFSIAFLLVGLIASILFLQSSPSPSWEFGEESTPLEKTSNLSFSAGDAYSYTLSFEGKNKSVSLNVKYMSDCRGIVIEDTSNSYDLCVSKSGFYSNSTKYMGDSDFVFYSPWMLYLHKNFSWNVNRTLTIYPSNITQKSQLLFEVKNVTEVFGRPVFEVHASKLSDSFADDFFANSTYFVDVEKRILLAANSSGAQILIKTAPFELKK